MNMLRGAIANAVGRMQEHRCITSALREPSDLIESHCYSFYFRSSTVLCTGPCDARIWSSSALLATTCSDAGLVLDVSELRMNEWRSKDCY
jgi:hypothetical protein